MRRKFKCCFPILLCFANFIVIILTFRFFLDKLSSSGLIQQPLNSSTHIPPQKRFAKLVTVVLYDFEPQENDVVGTVEAITKTFSSVQVLIITNENLYPPLQFEHVKNVKILILVARLGRAFTENPLQFIKTKYVLFIPDSTRIFHRQFLQQMIFSLEVEAMFAFGFAEEKKSLGCLKCETSLDHWTIQFTNETNKTACDFVTGKHAVLVPSSIMYKLNKPFIYPFPHSLYLQTSYLKYKVKIVRNIFFQNGKDIFRTHHSLKEKKKSDYAKYKNLYETYSIKYVVHENGLTESFGCTRDTPRCFGPVINYAPSYFYENKTTPPCCLMNLRKTAKHVFNLLQEAGVRHWLDGGSLIGAMRINDIIPWDYDVDIGFNRDDFHRLQWLRKAKSKPTIDTKGFLWERATEGNFYRVHFSKVNRIYVNLFPYLSKNGTMVKDAWYSSQSMDFPEQFLHPMSSIEFIGRSVPSPNNIREFLELKYGRELIDNDRYPDFRTKFT